MRRPPLIPQPRDVVWNAGQVAVGPLTITAVPPRLSRYHPQLTALAELITCDLALRPTPVHFATGDVPTEGYRLRIDSYGVTITAADSLGALHAMRTLVDIQDINAGKHLPEVEITDHPTFTTRGIFAESFTGSDRMTLHDWQLFIDRLAQLKFNTLGVSIYGCWDIHHHDRRSEFLFAPLPEFPELSSPQEIITWDPHTERETVLSFLPAMFEHDFFGDLIRYAADRGIEVIPHLGGPGHSTLIPRLVPALSALDDNGEPTGYGYCVSRPTAQETLRHLIRDLVRQHLHPNGIRRLHVAGDEYYPIRNVDPADRQRVVSPYCRCDECAALYSGEMLIRYLKLVGEALAAEGISMVHWHDTLVREGVLDDYLDRVDDAGLPQPVIAWWKYNDPVPTPDASRAENWSCPTVGLASFLFHQDFLPNIETVLRRGHQAGSSGALAYALPDPADHMNYAFLSDLSWNLESSGGAGEFRRRWAQRISPDHAESASHALCTASSITASYPLMMYVVQHILPFFATATAGATSYPDDLLRSVGIVQPPLSDVLQQTADTLRYAVSLMPETADIRRWPNPGTTWCRQHERLIASIELFLGVLDAARQDDPVSPTRLADLAKQGNELLRLVADSKPDYLAPAALREHWTFIKEIGPALERLRGGAGIPPAETWYAWEL